MRTVISTPSPSVASVTSAQRKAATSDRRSPPMNNSEAITASVRPRRCAVVWDSTPRPSVRGRSAVARIAASPSARSGAAWPRPPVGGRATVAAQHAGGRFPGGVGLAGELSPKPDGGDGEGGGGGRAALLEHKAEVGGQRGVVNRGGPAPGVQAPQRAGVGPSGVDADRGVGEPARGRRGDGQRPRRVGASGERGLGRAV